MLDAPVDFLTSVDGCNGVVGVAGVFGAAVVPSRVGNCSVVGLSWDLEGGSVSDMVEDVEIWIDEDPSVEEGCAVTIALVSLIDGLG